MLRFSWLDSELVRVEESQPGVWRIWLDVACKQLAEKDGVFSCKVWNEERPVYCAMYPKSFLTSGMTRSALRKEAEFCPALKELLDPKVFEEG
jgi:hypothetical protein